jgi:hypothetical protein
MEGLILIDASDDIFCVSLGFWSIPNHFGYWVVQMPLFV